MKTSLLLLTAALTLPATAQLALIRQGRESAGTPETGDRFGFAVCAGDFNRDGYDDLATGAPYEQIGTVTAAQAGFVTINRGSRFGLTWVNAMGLSPGGSALSDAESHQMGYALASADFNDDGFDDLAVGLPASTINSAANAGRVLIYMGGPNGLSATASQVLTQTPFGGANEAGDRFGATLAAGKLGTDNLADLVIGAPGEDAGAGAIFIIRGGASGLVTTQAFFYRPSDLGSAGGAFGSALAIGNVIGQAHADILVGAPDTDAGNVQNAGMVHLIIGASNTVFAANAQHFDAAADGEFYQTNGRFGASLAVGDFFNDDGELDVAIGAPGRNTGRGTVSLARGGLLALQWGTVLASTSPQDNAWWGYALAAGDFGGTGEDTLAVGCPLFDYPDDVLPGDGVNSGRVDTYSAQPVWPPPAGGNVIHEKKHGAGFSNNAQMGSSLVFGRFSQGPRASIAIGCPARDSARGQVLDYAPWRQVSQPECISALAADCEDRVVYALRPFDQVSIASTTKIMTVLLACEATQRPLNDPFHVGLEEEYTIEPWMMEAYPPTTGCSAFIYHSPAFDHYTLRELMHSAMIPSGNDSCYAIADAITGEIDAWEGDPCPDFFALMNARAAQIGMADSLFASASGVANAPAHYSTAYDMWLLGRAAMQNPLFRSIANTTEFDVPKLVPGAEAGIFEGAVAHLSWGWLKGLKEREPRIIGCKPGGTPGAGKTGVVAARQSVFPHGLAYATGFGWDNGTVSKDKLAELVQLALAECDPDYQGPDELAGPLAEQTWTVNDAQRSELSLTDFEHDGHAPGDEITLILYPLAPVEPRQAQPVLWKYRTMWELAPGQTATVEIGPIRAMTGAIGNAGTGAPGVGFLRSMDGGSTSFTLPAGGTWPMHTWSVPLPVKGYFSLTNAGNQPATFTLEATFEAHPDFMWFPASMSNHRVELRNDTASIREQHSICEAPLPRVPGAPFPMLVAIEDRGAGRQVRPGTDVSSYTVNINPAAGEVVLLFSSLPGGTFYDAFDIQWSPDFGTNAWQRAARLPANATGSYQWNGTVPPQERRRFFRITGVPAD